MKPGRVVTIRLNPTDCMTAVDLCEKMSIQRDLGMSFDQVVRIALSAAFETFRDGGIVPRRDGFEYTELMSRFGTTRGAARTAQLTKVIDGAQLQEAAGRVAQIGHFVDDPDKMRRRLRHNDLKEKNAAEGTLNFTEKDLIDFATLNEEFTELSS